MALPHNASNKDPMSLAFWFKRISVCRGFIILRHAGHFGHVIIFPSDTNISLFEICN